MNVHVTPAALDEIEVLRASGYRGTGFLLGAAIGSFVLLERLLPLDFDRRGGDSVYLPVYSTYGQRLQGVFFCRRRPFALDWFIGDLVLAVRPGRVELLRCEYSPSKRQARLEPLLQGKKGKWRN